MKRALLLVAGVLLLVLGITSAAVGAVLTATFGRNGTLSVDSGRIAGKGTALVSEPLSVSGGGDLQARLGEVTFGARSTGGNRIFVGVGPADAVFSYLEGKPYQVVSGIGNGKSTTRDVPGAGRPAPPATARFWIAQASGVDPSFTWPGSSAADVRVVVMNADASPGVAATLLVGFRSTTVFPLAMTLIGVGMVLGLVGVLLLVLAVRGWRRSRRSAQARPGALAPPPAAPAVAATALVAMPPPQVSAPGEALDPPTDA